MKALIVATIAVVVVALLIWLRGDRYHQVFVTACGNNLHSSEHTSDVAASPFGPLTIVRDKLAALIDPDEVLVHNAADVLVENSNHVAITGSILGKTSDKWLDVSAYNLLIYPSGKQVKIPATASFSGNIIVMPDEFDR